MLYIVYHSTLYIHDICIYLADSVSSLGSLLCSVAVTTSLCLVSFVWVCASCCPPVAVAVYTAHTSMHTLYVYRHPTCATDIDC